MDLGQDKAGANQMLGLANSQEQAIKQMDADRAPSKVTVTLLWTNMQK